MAMYLPSLGLNVLIKLQGSLDQLVSVIQPSNAKASVSI